MVFCIKLLTNQTNAKTQRHFIKTKDLNTRISQYEKDNVNEIFNKLEQLEEKICFR